MMLNEKVDRQREAIVGGGGRDTNMDEHNRIGIGKNCMDLRTGE